MYDNSNCPVGADNEYSPWNQKESHVTVGISLEVSKDFDLLITDSNKSLYQNFLESSDYIHLKKILNSIDLNIDNIEIFEV